MGIKKRTIVHKRNDCIGCGSCALLAPSTWSMNKQDGKADLVDGVKKKGQFVVAQIDESEYEANIEASKACPTKTIRF